MDSREIDLEQQSREIVHFYYCGHNWEKVLEFMDREQVSWVGVSKEAEVFGYEDLGTFFQKGCEESTKTQIVEESYREIGRGADYGIVYANLLLRVEEQGADVGTFRQRVSFIYHYGDNGWKATHIHVSVPGGMTGGSGHFPKLEEMVEEKLRQIESTAVNQLEIERKRYKIVADLTDDIIFEYDLSTDGLQIFYPSGEDSRKVKRVIDHAYYGEGARNIGVHPDDYESFRKEIGKVLERKVPGGPMKAEYRIDNGTDKYVWRRVLLKCVFDAENQLAKVVGKVIDISSEKELVKRSVTDTLTGAYNRGYIKKAAEVYMAGKSDEVSLCCMLLDVDYFKEINDNMGHLAGDRVLIDLVEVIRQMFRANDPVARIGGDEFMILMKDAYGKAIAEEKALNLLKAMNDHGKKMGYSGVLSLSIGIVEAKDARQSFEEICHQADIALYHAKHRGRNRYIVYEEGMSYPAE